MSQASDSGVSRRSFLRNLGAASVAASALPAFAGVQRAMAPQQRGGGMGVGDMSGLGGSLPADYVVISMNENPLGPAPSALEAIMKSAGWGNRYRGDIVQGAIATARSLFELKPGYVGLFPGSAGPLNLALASNIGPDRPLVYADPAYEQGAGIADMVGAPKFAVKLTPSYAHDVKAMVAATPKAGAYYIVNPNNPTGTTTPKADIVWLLKNKPAGSVVIVDEAYHHFSTEESCIDLVGQDQDIIVTRTFSKIYGMAGLRAGLAFARPDYFEKFRAISPLAPSLASISLTSAAGANAAMLDKDVVIKRRKINADVRSETLEFLAKGGYTILPGSQTNFFMVDVKRPGGEFQRAMLDEKVAIGRTWPALPTYVRVTVGTANEMAKFQTAFVKCMDKPCGPCGAAAEMHVPALNPSELNRGDAFFG
ncbi:MAG: aminotransferase class I/II-fold pyridoxal phosphate-dependent enzyme [Acidobacteriota bacterium]|nr:aminotransferase class I/II-fold pyridoxal phosphate-dependent enzyme [Acidobacteriota bacterium]